MFCTNGVLLRMLTSGDGLEGVTHIVVDEIHERDKFADFLLIMLRDLLPSKPHLHLVLMSATLNVALFTDYFHGCPLIQVPGYTYPVQVCLARACCNGARAAGCNVVLMGYCFKPHVQVCLAWACCNNKLLP
jgi:HrpA-like RNA helicase